MIKHILKVIIRLKNPYPEDIFTPVSKKQWAKIHKLLKDNMNIPLDRISGNLMRRGYDICKKDVVSKIEERR